MPQTQNPHQELLLKAAQDEAFREALIANPKETLSQYLGTALPAELRVTVVENSATELTLVIPPKLGDELEDADLDAVAGGGRSETLLKLKYAAWSIAGLGIGCLMSMAMNQDAKDVSCYI